MITTIRITGDQLLFALPSSWVAEFGRWLNFSDMDDPESRLTKLLEMREGEREREAERERGRYSDTGYTS